MGASVRRTSKPVPVRMCVVCRQRSDKRALTRVVSTPEGVQIDPTGRANGRGAYVCDQPRCWQVIANSDILARALRTS